MKRLFALLGFFLLIQHPVLKAQDKAAKPDTVTAGIYITSIHNIDFKDKEFTISFWVWFKYDNPAFDFYNNLEIPSAKSVEKSFYTIDTTGGKVYMLMKLQCVMKDSWRINNFPFDHQKLRLSIENSQFDAGSFVFKVDNRGEFYDKRFTLRDWDVDSCVVEAGRKNYETAFGDDKLIKPHMEYSNFKVRLDIKRDVAGIFWKMFLGMYIGFLIAIVCFFIHIDGMDSRFALAVGAVFAVIGNKYIVDSALPDSSAFTLVDLLHALTLSFILVTIGANAWSLRLVKRDKLAEAARFDKLAGRVMLVLYILLNIYFIWRAR